MTDEMKSKIKNIISKQLAVAEEQVTDDSSFVEDLNADSLDLVEMIMAFEEEFSIEISDEEAENIKTVKDIYTYIDNRLGEKSE